jgi:hypothetical protein
MEDEFEVFVKNSRDDDTESLYIGTERECHIFLDAYLHAMITYTSYAFNERDLAADWVYMASPLVSQENLLFTISKRPDNLENLRFNFNDGMTA